MIPIKRNLTLFRFYYFFWRFKPLAALMIIYFAKTLGSYAAAMAVFSIINISYAFIKVPSGFISDKIGRKPILLLANILMTSSFLLLALSGEYETKWLLYLFALMCGCGEALSAGTIEAMMFETMEDLKQSHNFKILYSKSMYYDQLGCAFGAFCAMTITYFLPLQFVAWLSVLPPFMQLIVSYFFIEPLAKRKKVSLSLKNVFVVLRQFIQNKKLAFYTLADIYFSTLGDISHRFEGIYFKTFTSEWVISLAKVLKHVFGMVGFAIIPVIKRFSRPHIFFGSIICNVLVRTIALILNNFCVPFVHMFINFFYATASTAKTDILQHEFLPEYRASSQAIIQFIKSIYMSGMMFLVGIFADIYGIYMTMIFLVALRLLGLSFVYIWHKYASLRF